MDKNTAAYLLESLIERIEVDQLGTVSKAERQALHFALVSLRGQELLPITEAAPAVAITQDGTQELLDVPSPPKAVLRDDTTASVVTLPEVDVDISSLERDEPSDPNVLICLDFGTAMSKAFATYADSEHLDLELGKAAGRSGYTLPSSIFIGNDERVYFGYEAIGKSQELVDSGRKRLDSIKGWLSLKKEGDLDSESCVLQKSLNPTDCRLTQGDMIRIYLAYLTDITCCALADWKIGEENIGRYAKRRFARPCWPDPAQAIWANSIMRSMLAEAQVIADTFSGRWDGGIGVNELKNAIEKIKKMEKRPDYLIDEGVPEPVAVAAGAFSDSENLRDAFMVVDIGAGTTDFGLFVASTSKETGERLVSQVPVSIQGLMQAGDKVDQLLLAFIKRKESVDAHDTAGELIVADLVRRIRSMKEVLFKSSKLEYALADGTTGLITVGEFLEDKAVEKFAQSIENGFLDSLSAVDDTWLHWLSLPGVNLHVVLTGGSSKLPMMKSLGQGFVDVRNFKISRKLIDPTPEWITDSSPDLIEIYPQLAVAVGGASEELPQTLSAPPVFGGGSGKTAYQPASLQISGI